MPIPSSSSGSSVSVGGGDSSEVMITPQLNIMKMLQELDLS